MVVVKRVAAAVGSSLKLKLTLFILSILGLTAGIAPWSAIKMQERQLLMASQEHLQAMEGLLKSVIATSMLAGDRDNVQRVVEAVGLHEDVKDVRIFDTAGMIRFSSHAAERGTRLSPTEEASYHGLTDPVIVVRQGEAVRHTLLQPMFNQPPCFKCHPSDQKVLGILQISLSLDQTWQQLATLKRAALVATLITGAVVVLGIWLSLTFLIDQPLQRLVAVMGRAEGGDLGVRADIGNADELGRLAGHFNTMIAKLDDAQVELKRYHQEQLARADRLATIGEMAAAMAHEIRNPLTGISGALSVLSRDFPAADPRRDIVREIHLLIERLNKSVQEILHYSRPSQPQCQPVRIDEIVDRTLSLLEGEARKARISVVKQSDPEADGLPTVNVDPQQIQQVLMNLILNSIQATAPGGQISLRMHRSANHEGKDFACVEVVDSGKGMTTEEAAKAFHPFFSTKAKGTGLGLAIAKQIVEQHGGRISLQSTPGQGTCVRVELPADLTPQAHGS
jgi:two-component system, NtrC family, sensor kinase